MKNTPTDLLLDATAQHAATPDTFKLPCDHRLDQLKPGDFVKVCRNNERFWIQVSGRRGNTIDGLVANILGNPDNYDLPVDAPVTLERRHVYDTILAHAGETTGEMNQPINPDRRPPKVVTAGEMNQRD